MEGGAWLAHHAKIENLGVPAHGDKDVCRFNVAMHDTLSECRIQSLGDFRGDFQELFQFHGPARYDVLQGLPIEILHADKRLPVMVVNFMDGADVRVI